MEIIEEMFSVIIRVIGFGQRSEYEMSSDYLDSYTVVMSEEVGNTIKSFVEPIFTPSQIIYDLHELRQPLANTKHFFVT